MSFDLRSRSFKLNKKPSYSMKNISIYENEATNLYPNLDPTLNYNKALIYIFID